METPNIEPTNVETPNTETNNAVNPNMKTCKHCGHIVAKNAKTCPSCGGKLKKNLGCLIGCSTPVIIVIICVLALFSFFGTKGGTIGKTYKYGIVGEFCVNNVESFSAVELIGTGLVHTLEDGESAVVIEFDFENTGKNDTTIEASDVKVNYKDGITYKGECLYLLDDSNSYTPYAPYEHGFELEKVTSDKESFIVVVPVPNEVIKDTSSSLVVEIYNREYTVE